MSVQGLAAVEARIGQIQARIDGTLRAAGFADVLARTLTPDSTTMSTATAPQRVHPRRSSAWDAPAAGGGAVDDGWVAALPEAGRAWAGPIEQAARAADVDPRLLAALVWAESGFRPDARSGAGAVGLAQLMPGTAAGLGVDPHDPVENLTGGARYLRAQLDRFGSPALALAAYNAGPGRVAQAGGIPRIPETQAYVPRVLGYYRRLGGWV